MGNIVDQKMAKTDSFHVFGGSISLIHQLLIPYYNIYSINLFYTNVSISILLRVSEEVNIVCL